MCRLRPRASVAWVSALRGRSLSLWCLAVSCWGVVGGVTEKEGGCTPQPHFTPRYGRGVNTLRLW